MIDELAGAVRRGDLHPRDLVAEALRRIEASDLNAVVRVRDHDELMAEADAHPRSGPLAGLPLLVKDLSRCIGMPTTFCSPWYADAPIDDVDDPVVERLKGAGAIVVGKSNSPEFGHQAVTTNRLFGTTRNPWNPAKAPAGSSGGSAAALAAGLVPLATTSDGGGSVRLPASACGLVGYKPTNGLFGRRGAPRWIDFSTLGCTGSSVADVLTEARASAGGFSGDILNPPEGSVDLTPRMPVRVVAVRSFRSDVDASIDAAFAAALEGIERDLGVAVERVDSPFDGSEGLGWFTMASVELASTLRHEEHRWGECEPSLAFQLEWGSRTTAEQYVHARRLRYEAAARLDAILGDGVTVLVVPTVNAEMWPAEGPMATRAGSTDDPAIAANTTELNFTGHPGVSVPLGLDSAGVPFGMQVIARRWDDALALGFASMWERARPWPLTAPGHTTFASAFALG